MATELQVRMLRAVRGLRLGQTWMRSYRQLSSGRVVAIRREDNSVWERRAPLSPAQVRVLVRDGVKVLVQPSNRRAYPMQVCVNKCWLICDL